MLRKLLTISLVAAALGLSGCVFVDADSADFSVSGSWTVNGYAPTTASCAAAGIDGVEVTFYSGGSNYVEHRLYYACESGYFSTGRILYWGDYDTEWASVGFDGATIAVGPRLPLTVYGPTAHAELQPADFVY